MKIKYDKPKGQRANRYFFGMRCVSKDGESYWYYYNEDKWYLNKEVENEEHGCCSNYNEDINTLKGAIRKIKKYSKYLPKGTEFYLSNRYRDYDVKITI